MLFALFYCMSAQEKIEQKEFCKCKTLNRFYDKNRNTSTDTAYHTARRGKCRALARLFVLIFQAQKCGRLSAENLWLYNG